MSAVRDEYLYAMIGQRVRLAQPMEWPGMVARGSHYGIVRSVTARGLWRIRRDNVATTETWLPDFWEWVKPAAPPEREEP